MKFVCDKDVIMREISVATDIISSKTTLSILSNVLMEASDQSLKIRATDLKVSFETAIPVTVESDGRTTVFCDKLLGILRSLPSGEVEFETSGSDRMIIRPRGKKIDFRLKCIEADKFPEIQLAVEDAYWEFPQKEFIEMISQTVFAVSDDETRYFMNGVYMENQEGALIMVATDGRRLAHVKKYPTSEMKEFPGIIIPPKVLTLIRKQASGEGSFSIAVTEKNLFVRFENQKISSALIDGQFPNYKRVIPEEQIHELTVSRVELAEALRRVSLLVEKSRRIYVDLRPEAILMRSEETDIGAASEEISCDYNGPELTIALNYLYLSEPLKAIQSERVRVRFTESNKAVTLQPDPETDYFHIVMPMQLD
ncbi:MAG: DNA polymerase III subunit beta [Spirochaetia bacterium]